MVQVFGKFLLMARSEGLFDERMATSSSSKDSQLLGRKHRSFFHPPTKHLMAGEVSPGKPDLSSTDLRVFDQFPMGTRGKVAQKVVKSPKRPSWSMLKVRGCSN